jgi:hypothetical protein
LIDLDELREVYTVIKRVGNGLYIRREAVRCDLERLPRSGETEPFDKDVRCGFVAAPSSNDLAISLALSKSPGFMPGFSFYKDSIVTNGATKIQAFQQERFGREKQDLSGTGMP